MFRLALHWQILIAMLVGAVFGLILNLAASSYEMAEPVKVNGGKLHPYGLSSAVDVEPGTLWVRDKPQQIQLQITEATKDSDGGKMRRIFVGALEDEKQLDELKWGPVPADVKVEKPPPKPKVYASLGELKNKDAAAFALFQRQGRSTGRTIGDVFKMIGDLFLRMLKMVAVPLIIASLLTGVLGLGQAERLGKMFGRTLLYYVCTSMLAIIIGLSMVNIIRPGASAKPEGAVVEAPPEEGKRLTTVLFEQIENLIPANPFAAIADGNFLSIIAFTLAFGIFAVLVGGKTFEFIRDFASAAFEVMMKMTMAIIMLAPLGVLCLMLAVTATQGAGIFGQLGLYMLTVFCALMVHAVVVLPLILKYVARRDPLEFAKAMSPALLTAFSSASSNATLPLTLTNVEQRAGVSNRVSSFVLPLGATVNMDGTALYEVVAVLFIANMTPGVDLSFPQQVMVAFTALLASIGAAGIPHAGLVMMVIILQAVGLPTEKQGLIIAVDRVLDMCRTSVNVWSDSCGCAVIARFEGEEESETEATKDAPPEDDAAKVSDDETVETT